MLEKRSDTTPCVIERRPSETTRCPAVLNKKERLALRDTKVGPKGARCPYNGERTTSSHMKKSVRYSLYQPISNKTRTKQPPLPVVRGDQSVEQLEWVSIFYITIQ